MNSLHLRPVWQLIALLLLFWASRAAALEALPLHNDEGLHLTRAIEVWNLHPFWQISDGKIINHWAIAIFYPQHAPAFVSRIATVFVGLIGLAAGMALARRVSGASAALLAGTLWLTCPYLFFYERTALSDAETGALVVLALWASLRLAQTGRRRDVVLTGLTLAAAALFKFTAAPFALAVALVVLLLGRQPSQVRLRNLVIIILVGAACFAVPIGYLLTRERDLFAIALSWLSSSSDANSGAAANLARLWAQLIGFNSVAWSIALLAGMALLLVFGRRTGRVLALATLLPLTIIIVLGSEVLPRHYVVALPPLLVLAGAGLDMARRRVQNPVYRTLATQLGIIALALGLLNFALPAYTDPANLTLPDAMRTQYITDHSSGYGLREAVQAFPTTITRPNTPIIASMFPDSCKRANFYAVARLTLDCPQLPGRAEIEAALETYGAVYVLADSAPGIGIDVTMLAARATRVAAYPRPGESDAAASVVLWLLEAN